MDLHTTLEGVTCPLVTPFEPETGAVDERGLRAVVDHLIDGGIDGLFACGTTGEFASLTPDERRRVHGVVVDQVDGRVPVLVSAAATSVGEAIAYADHAAEIGADAAVVTEPYFHDASGPTGTQAFLEQVADRSPLPLLLYNIPQCTGSSIPLETIEAVANHETVAGIKDSSGDLASLLAIDRRTPEGFLVLQGYDALLVPALRMGIDGGLNAGANVAPSAYRRLVEHATDDEGQAIQDAIAPLFDACSEYGFAPTCKTALVAAGVLEHDGVRPPLRRVPDSGQPTVVAGLEALRDWQ